jgi:hypothetical protein
MPRGILLIAGLVMVSAVFGQGQTANQSTTTAPVNGPFGGPMLTTPSAGFPNPVPTAGISDAGRAGISNATNTIETTNTPSNPETLVTTPSASLPESTNQAPANELGTSQPAIQPPVNDLGTSTSFVGGSEESASGTTSLAEVSSRYKAEKGTRNAKVLSNEDVQAMLNNKSGVTMAKNMPPLGPGALEQGGQTQNAGAQSPAVAATQPVQQNAQANAQTSQPGQNSTPSQASTAASSSKGQSAAQDTDAANSTTPQINQNQQSNDAQGSRRLPATATFLPLLGLLGLVSGGIGFWFRKLRN